jgi:uncharacterized protein YhaN
MQVNDELSGDTYPRWYENKGDEMAHIEDSIRSGELSRYQPIFDAIETALDMSLTDEQRQKVVVIMEEYDRQTAPLMAQLATLQAEIEALETAIRANWSSR